MVYDIEADGTVDWQNSALVITATLNFTVSHMQEITSKIVYHRPGGSMSLLLFLVVV